MVFFLKYNISIIVRNDQVCDGLKTMQKSVFWTVYKKKYIVYSWGMNRTNQLKKKQCRSSECYSDRSVCSFWVEYRWVISPTSIILDALNSAHLKDCIENHCTNNGRRGGINNVLAEWKWLFRKKNYSNRIFSRNREKPTLNCQKLLLIVSDKVFFSTATIW